MVGWDGLRWVTKKAWWALSAFLDLRDAREVVLSLASASLGVSVIGEVLSELRAIPDIVFWPAFVVVSLLFARFVAWAIGRSIRPPSTVVPPAAPTATTSGPNSPALAAYSATGPIIQNTGSGQINVILPGTEPRDIEDAKRLQEQERTEADRLHETQQEPVQGGQADRGQADKIRDERVMWLATLASLRNVGVARRNELAGLRGGNAEIDAEAKYVAWLRFALPKIRELPVHGPHEAHAFETLDRFRLDAAPVGSYATARIATIAAMFSTHLERIEEIRKRYTMTWPL